MAVRVRPINNINRVNRKANNEASNKRKRSRCYVDGCDGNVNTSMHTLSSKNRDLRNSWLKALKLNPFFEGIIYVCGNHFKHNDFAEFRDNRTYVRLKRNAVPSINLPTENRMIAFVDVSPVSEELDDLVNENKETAGVSDYQSECIKDSGRSDKKWNQQGNSRTVDMGIDMPNFSAAFKNNDSETQSDISEPVFEDDVDSDDFNMKDDVVATDEETLTCRLMEEEETIKQYEDKCLQTNLAYDESLRKVSFIDMLKSDDMLQTWTGISTFSLLWKIVNCIRNLPSSKSKMSTFRAAPETLIILVMARIKTNLKFKQLACLFGFTPDTTARYIHDFIPILKAVLSPATFTSKEYAALKKINCLIATYPVAELRKDIPDCKYVD